MNKKFRVVKRFSLDFLGEGWKDAYINFEVLTIGDIKDKFPALAKLQEQTKDDVTAGMNSILGLLNEKFINGQAPDEKGLLVDLTAEDLVSLPAEVLSKALSFLSQDTTVTSQ